MSSKIPIRLLDAGLGTTLESPPHNAQFRSGSPLWSSDFLITSPKTLSGVHEAFVEAGADVLLTATYQASSQGFVATRKLSKLNSKSRADPVVDVNTTKGSSKSSDDDVYSPAEAASFMRSAVPLAKRASTSATRDRKSGTIGHVALSLGAYGAIMQPSAEYSGDYKPESILTAQGLQEWHQERLKVFRDNEATWSEIDYVSFETIPVLNEVHAVRAVMANQNTRKDSKDWWISCVFPNDDLTLPDGSPVSKVVQAMLEHPSNTSQRPWGIGINCTDIQKLHQLILQYEDAVKDILGTSERTQWPWLVTYPDGAQGSVYNTGTQKWETNPQIKARGPQRPWHEALAEIITETAERGYWDGILVGGCCKTTPDDIRNLRGALRSSESDAFYLETG
ncbi:MAG: hypothetical protein Q9220_003747 [cf. Caloplaca sp. 1 TL-2023]